MQHKPLPASIGQQVLSRQPDRAVLLNTRNFETTGLKVKDIRGTVLRNLFGVLPLEPLALCL